MFVGEHGSPYTRFRRALAAGNPLLVTAAALELGCLSLADALAVCLVFRDHDRERYERAAVRWLARKPASVPARAPRGENKAKLLDALKDGPMTASEIASATGIATASVSTMLTRMVKTGELAKAQRGYRLPQ